MSPRISKNNTGLTLKELATELVNYTLRVTALGFCERIGATHAIENFLD